MPRKSADAEAVLVVIEMEFGVVIVGAGIAGLCMAMTLRRAGRSDFVILEKGHDLGGTWRDNDYPGCKSDVPAQIYSFSFAMDAGWSRRQGSQPEILSYLHRTAQRFDITRTIRFNTTVVSAAFDSDNARWVIDTEDGSRYHAAALILAIGTLHRPAIPAIPGLETFAGPVFHTAEWDHGYDLTGRNIAVIGTGASAIQVVPHIAPSVSRLHVFQRSAAWILPRTEWEYNSAARVMLRDIAALAMLYRWFLYWRAEVRVLAFRRLKWFMRIIQLRARRYLYQAIQDNDLRVLLTPHYTLGCKPLVLSNTYYSALNRSNVELVGTPIATVGESSVTTADGVTRPADAIILATGFQALNSLDLIQVSGRDGMKLKDAWEQGPQAFLGIHVAGFPNFFLMIGPNSGVAHTSLMFMIEYQARHIAHALNRHGQKNRLVEVDPAVQQKFNAVLQRKLRHAVWSTGGCRNWYLDENGINRILWPDSMIAYWLRVRRVSDRDFIGK